MCPRKNRFCFQYVLVYRFRYRIYIYLHNFFILFFYFCRSATGTALYDSLWWIPYDKIHIWPLLHSCLESTKYCWKTRLDLTVYTPLQIKIKNLTSSIILVSNSKFRSKWKPSQTCDLNIFGFISFDTRIGIVKWQYFKYMLTGMLTIKKF